MTSPKLYLSDLFSSFTIPVRSGPLQGLRMSVSSGSRLLRGTYEPAHTERLANNLQPGDVFYDIGAHVGYLSLVASRRVGDAGQVYAFEPRPRNARFLARHIERNRLANVRLFPAGLAEIRGTLRFESRIGSGRGHLSDTGDIEVPVYALDQLLADEGLRPPTLIKMDVEGAEDRVLQGAARTIADHHPRLMISTHGRAKFESVMAFLDEHGYGCEVIEAPGHEDGPEIFAT